MLFGEKKKRNKSYYAFFSNLESRNFSHFVAAATGAMADKSAVATTDILAAT